MTHSAFDFAPWRLSGQVFGVLMNHRPALAALGEAVHAAPYKAPPRAPVLYLKPRNTRVGPGALVAVPADVAALEVGAALGLVMGRTACRLRAAEAMSAVAGVVAVADLSVPHDSFYRPSVRLKARDGFCPLGLPVPLHMVGDVDALAVAVSVDGQVVHCTTTGDRVRTAAQLLADVTEFMTLSPGDVLMLGVSAGAPRVAPGQAVDVRIQGLGDLSFRLVGERAEEPA